MSGSAPVGIPIAVAGILYIVTLGVRLIPERASQRQQGEIGERRYQADVVVVRGQIRSSASRCAGRS